MTSISLPDVTYQRLVRQAARLNLSVEALLDRMAGDAAGPELSAPIAGFGAMMAAYRAGYPETVGPVADAGHVSTNTGDTEPTPADRDRAYAGLMQLLDGLDITFPPGHRMDDSRESIYAGCGE